MTIKNLNINSNNISKFVKAGTLALAIGLSSMMATGCNIQDENQIKVEDLVVDNDKVNEETTVNVDDINKLNLIICNDQVSTDVFANVTEKLDDLGVDFTSIKFGDPEMKDKMATVITLDGRNYHTDSTVIIGPDDNNRYMNDDILALSMVAGLKHSGAKCDGVRLGLKDTEKNDRSRVPSDTEINIDESSSFVTIAVGEDATDYEAIANGVVDGLIRATSVINDSKAKGDFLYKTGHNDINTENLARTLSTTEHSLSQVNQNVDFDFLQVNETITNPCFNNFSQFDGEASYKLDISNVTKK